MMPEHKYDDVLIRYLLDESNDDERVFVQNWINQDDENKLYFENLRNALYLIGLRADSQKLNVDEEWNQFQDKVQKAQNGFDFNKYTTITESNLREGRKYERAKIYKLIISTAVAASLLFIVALRGGWFGKGDGNQNVQEQSLAPANNKIDSLLAVKVHEINSSGKIKNLVLPDGTLVALSNNSELTYEEPSERNKRDVNISGKADFDVAKDKTKPFTVYSEAISTTALGTRFSVTNLKNGNSIVVRLNEGKVEVKLLKPVQENRMKNYFLLPGQELVYDKTTELATVMKFSSSKRGAQNVQSHEELYSDNPSIPKYDKKSWFMFNNQPLNEVFDALEEMYDRKIFYSKKDVDKISFIGTFDKSDSLESILKKIAFINDLQVSKDSNSFRIKK